MNREKKRFCEKFKIPYTEKDFQIFKGCIIMYCINGVVKAVKILSRLKIEGADIPSIIVEVKRDTVRVHRTCNYNIDRVLTVSEIPCVEVSSYEEFIIGADDDRIQNILTQSEFMKITVNENCILGLADRFYRECGDNADFEKELKTPAKLNIRPFEMNLTCRYLLDKSKEVFSEIPHAYAAKMCELLKEADDGKSIILNRHAKRGELEKAVFSVLGAETAERMVCYTDDYYDYQYLLWKIGGFVNVFPPELKTECKDPIIFESQLNGSRDSDEAKRAVLLSSVAEWKTDRNTGGKLIRGFLFNKEYFTETDEAVMCGLWTKEENRQDTIRLEAYNIRNGNAVYEKLVLIQKVYIPDKPRIFTAISCDSIVTKPLMVLTEKNYITMIPFLVAMENIEKEWYKKDIYAFSDDFLNDDYSAFCRKCMIYYCLSETNRNISKTDEEGRIQINELCFDGNAQAWKDYKWCVFTEEEQKLVDKWMEILEKAKETGGYKPEYTYNPFQTRRDLCNEKESELERELNELKKMVKKFREETIYPLVDKYEILK